LRPCTLAIRRCAVVAHFREQYLLSCLLLSLCLNVMPHSAHVCGEWPCVAALCACRQSRPQNRAVLVDGLNALPHCAHGFSGKSRLVPASTWRATLRQASQYRLLRLLDCTGAPHAMQGNATLRVAYSRRHFTEQYLLIGPRLGTRGAYSPPHCSHVICWVCWALFPCRARACPVSRQCGKPYITPPRATLSGAIPYRSVRISPRRFARSPGRARPRDCSA
jgi:hypothetical protein